MGLMSSKLELEKLTPGDHIYAWRGSYSYSHHGIYVGDGKVIHLTRGPGLILFSNDISQQSNDRVVCCSIEDFLCDGQLYRFEYGVSRFLFLSNRPGTCSLVSSNPPELVLYRATYLLESGFGNYNLLNRNCEDFAIYCKTGFLNFDQTHSGGISGQILSFSAALLAVTIIPYQFLPASLIDQALVVCGLYCLIRLSNDIGFKSSGCAVAVEELGHSSDAHDVRENMNVNVMENSTKSWFLDRKNYIGYTIVAIRYWYWTPESKIRVWLKSALLYMLLYDFVISHLRLHGFKLGEHSAYTIWLFGYFFWRWTSVSAVILWTRLFFLLILLRSLIYGHPRRFKLDTYIFNTLWALGLWYWTPRSTVLLWIKLILVHILLHISYVPDQLCHHSLFNWTFFACFVIQSIALFLGLDYSDYFVRITKHYLSKVGVLI